MQRQSAAGAIVGLVFVIVAVVALGVLVAIQLQDLSAGSLSPLALPTVLATALLVPIAAVLGVFLVFKILNVARVTSLARDHPGSYLAQLVITTPLKWQLRAAAATLDLPAPRVRGNSYATVVVDRLSIRIFHGAVSPRSVLRLPVSSLVSATAVDREIGVRVLTTITLVVAGPHGRAEVDLVPFDSTGLFPRSMQGGTVVRELQRMRAVIDRD